MITQYEMGSAVFCATLLAHTVITVIKAVIGYVIYRGKIKAATEAVDKLNDAVKAVGEIKRERDPRYN